MEKEEAEQFCRNYGFDHIETSAITDMNVNESFGQIAKLILEFKENAR